MTQYTVDIDVARVHSRCITSAHVRWLISVAGRSITSYQENIATGRVHRLSIATTHMLINE